METIKQKVEKGDRPFLLGSSLRYFIFSEKKIQEEYFFTKEITLALEAIYWGVEKDLTEEKIIYTINFFINNFFWNLLENHDKMILLAHLKQAKKIGITTTQRNIALESFLSKIEELKILFPDHFEALRKNSKFKW